MDEFQMLSGIKERQQKAFDVLFDQYFPRVTYFSMKIVCSREEAEDITIRAFTKCWEKAVDFTSFDEVVNFIYRVARNAALDYLDKNKAKNNYLRHMANMAASDRQIHIDHIIYKMEMVANLYAEIDKLPDQCRTIIKLRYLENLSSSEIAQQMNITASTVRSQIQRGVGLLRHVFSEKELLFLLFLSSGQIDN